MAKVSELRQNSTEELNALYNDLSKELFHLRSEKRVTSKMEKPHLVRAKKRERAQVKTIMREIELKK